MRKIKIIVLCVICLSFNVYAQKDTVNLKEIIISSNRIPTFFSESNRLVKIITKKEIENAPVQNVNELLDYALNVDVRQRGGEGVQADISIRGGSFEQTLILLNGIRMNDPQTGHYSMDIPVNINDIERIEIIQGGGASIFGTNAFCGAINIVTSDYKERTFKASLSGGDFGLYDGSVSLNISNDKGGAYISINKKACDGYTKNTDFDILNMFMRFTYFTKIADIEAQGGTMSKSYGANAFYTPKYPNQFEDVSTLLGNIKISAKKYLHLTFDVFSREHNDKFELFRDNPPSWYKGHNYHSSHENGADINWNINSFLGKTAIGSEIRRENILSNVLGKPMNMTIQVPRQDTIAKYTKSDSRDNISIFLNHNFVYEKFNISAGVMENWNSAYDWATYYSVDIGYKFNDIIKSYASVNSSLRLPTFTDLYYVGPYNKGNISLIPEQALTYEIGIKNNINDVVSSSISAFRREGTNIIDWVKMPDSVKWESKNITEILSYGIEFSTSFYPKKVFGDDFFISLITLNYAYINIIKHSGDYISYYALDNLKNKLSITIQHKIYKNFGASWAFMYQQRNGTYTDFITSQEVSYKAFYTIDGKIFWNYKNLKLFAEATNIFDTHYFDFGNIPMAGRWIKGGISYTFDEKRK